MDNKQQIQVIKADKATLQQKMLADILKDLSKPGSINALDIFIKDNRLDNTIVIQICSAVIHSKQIDFLNNLSDTTKLKMLTAINTFGDKALHDALPFQAFASRTQMIKQIRIQLGDTAPASAFNLFASFTSTTNTSTTAATSTSTTTQTTTITPPAVAHVSKAEQDLADHFSAIAGDTLSKPFTYDVIAQAVQQISNSPAHEKQQHFNKYLAIIEDRFDELVPFHGATTIPAGIALVKILIEKDSFSLLAAANSTQKTNLEKTAQTFGMSNFTELKSLLSADNAQVIEQFIKFVKNKNSGECKYFNTYVALIQDKFSHTVEKDQFPNGTSTVAISLLNTLAKNNCFYFAEHIKPEPLLKLQNAIAQHMEIDDAVTHVKNIYKSTSGSPMATHQTKSLRDLLTKPCQGPTANNNGNGALAAAATTATAATAATDTATTAAATTTDTGTGTPTPFTPQ